LSLSASLILSHNVSLRPAGGGPRRPHRGIASEVRAGADRCCRRQRPDPAQPTATKSSGPRAAGAVRTMWHTVASLSALSPPPPMPARRRRLARPISAQMSAPMCEWSTRPAACPNRPGVRPHQPSPQRCRWSRPAPGSAAAGATPPPSRAAPCVPPQPPPPWRAARAAAGQRDASSTRLR
jgi:hypothetical protein